MRPLIEQRCGVRLAVRAMGTYLAHWGFAAQKPLRRADAHRPAEMRRWLRQHYPAVMARDKQGLKCRIISHMRRLSKLPNRIRSFFRHQPVRYAA